MKVYISFVSATLLVYLFIHNPLLSVIGGIGAIKLLYLFVPLLCIIKGVNIGVFIRKYSWFLISFAVVLFYSVLRTGGESAYSCLVAFIEVGILPVLLCGLFEKTTVNYIQVIICVGIIGSIISTFCIVDPSFNNFIKYELQVIQTGSYLDINSFRGFGISDALTSTYGIVQGALLAFLFYYFPKHKWLILFFPFFLLSILLNARTGAIVAFLGIFYCILKKKMFGGIILLVAVTVIIIGILPLLISQFDISDDSVQFVKDFFDEVTAFVNSGSLEDSETSSDILKGGFVFPSDIFGLIFGEGRIIMGAKGVHSDVGFSNDLFLGGIVYCFIAYRLIFLLLKRLSYCKVDKPVIFILCMMIIIANTKGISLPNSGELRFFVLSCLYLYSFGKQYSLARN